MKKWQITEIGLEIKDRRDTPQQVLKAGGFDFGESKPDWENEILKDFRNRKFNGLRFSEISVRMPPPTQKWDELKVEIGRN